jgi:predicted HicB family RNase H-like nuclease
VKPIFEYKGYLGSGELSIDDNLLVGRLLFIRDVVSYVAASPRELEQAFHESVDEYLVTCAELGDAPDVPFKGSFNVRTGPEKHRSAMLDAIACETSLNDWVCQAIDAKLAGHQAAVTNLTVNVYGKKTFNDHVATTGPGITWTNRATPGPADIVRH